MSRRKREPRWHWTRLRNLRKAHAELKALSERQRQTIGHYQIEVEGLRVMNERLQRQARESKEDAIEARKEAADLRKPAEAHWAAIERNGQPR